MVLNCQPITNYEENMNEYELYIEKRAEFTGPYLSDKMLEKGEVITFKVKISIYLIYLSHQIVN